MTAQTVTYHGSTATLNNTTINCSCGTTITAQTNYDAIATWMTHATPNPRRAHHH